MYNNANIQDVNHPSPPPTQETILHEKSPFVYIEALQYIQEGLLGHAIRIIVSGYYQSG